MTMLLLLKPIFHQGGTGRKHRKQKKAAPKAAAVVVPEEYVAQLSETLEMPPVDVRGYVETVLAREAEIVRLKEEELRLREEMLRRERVAAEIEEEKRLRERIETEARALLEFIQIMAQKALVAKRKRLNMMIASLMEWL